MNMLEFLRMQLMLMSRRSCFLFLVFVSFMVVSLLLVHSSFLAQPLLTLHFSTLRPTRSLNSTFENVSSEVHFPRLNLTSQGYVLSVQYCDQYSNALYRLLSMQCWAGTLNLSVVEPFVLGNSKLGIGEFHRDFKNNTSLLRLSDVYDINHWNTETQQIASGNYPVLVNWNEFLVTAPRRLVMVEILYNISLVKCTFHDFTGWPEFFQQYGFFIVRRVCIHLNPRHPIMQADFNAHIYPDGIKDTETILFNNWKGIKHNTVHYNNIGLIDSKCTLLGSGYDWVAKLNPAVYGNASHYINEYLGGTEYISVMLRTELLVTSGLEQKFDKCLTTAINAWKAVTHEIESVKTFVTSDTGFFGSQKILSQPDQLLRYKFQQSVLSTLHINESTLQARQRILMATAGTTNPAFIALIEKAIAVQARCIVLVGLGRFQKHAAELYQSQHRVEEQCIIKFKFCNLELVIPPHLRKML